MISNRLSDFKNNDILRLVDLAEVRCLSPKAKDCRKQLNEASCVWAVDGKKFLFVFAKKSEGDQKVTVWGIKSPGFYQRIKTVLIANEDDILEAIPVFLTEYFELQLAGLGYRVDEDWYLDIQDELAGLARQCPSHLKPKLKLIRIWTSLMPHLTKLIEDLDSRDATNSVVKDKPLISQVQDSEKNSSNVGSIEIPDSDINVSMDTDLLIALLGYEFSCIITDTLRPGDIGFASKSSRLLLCGQCLMDKAAQRDIPEGEKIRMLVALGYCAQYAEIYEMEEVRKSLSKLFQNNVGKMMASSKELTLDYLALLVTTRRFCKRLPKEISAFIKDTLNDRVHSKSLFWKDFPELTNISGKMQKLWIQCMSLNLYGYDPNKSYTAKDIDAIAPQLLESGDADALLYMARIAYSCNLWAVQFDNFDTMVNSIVKKSSDRIAILKLETAKRLYQEFRQRNPMSRRGKEIIERGSSSVDSSSNEEGTRQSADTDVSIIDRHQDWLPEIEHFMTLQEQVVSLRDFCLVKNLPYEEFLEFYRAVMTDMNDFYESDPFIKKLLTLPQKAQEEYHRLFERQTESTKEAFECLVILSGVKVDIQKLTKNPDMIKPMIDKVINGVNKFRPEDAPVVARFLVAYEKMQRVGEEIESFRRRYV